MQEQPVISQVRVGPAAWPHSKFRLTEEQLLQNGGRIQIDPKITVERFRIFCEFVEEHGVWNTTKAGEAGIEDASLVHSSVYHHSNLLPKVYWRPGWGRGTPRRKTLEEPASLAPTNRHLLSRIAKLEMVVDGQGFDEHRSRSLVGRLEKAEQELVVQTERIDDAHNRFNQEWYKKPTKWPSRFERFRRGLGHRLVYLVKGK